MEEETFQHWRPVVGYEGLYEISDDGQVRRIGKAARTGKGRGGGARIGRILVPLRQRQGYLLVQLWKDGRPKMRLIHRLVAEAFIQPISNRTVVNHKDGVKAHNSYTNLEVVTSSQNNTHAIRTGLRKPHSSLTPLQVSEILALRQKGMGCRRLARMFSVSKSTITNVFKREDQGNVRAV